MISMHSLEVCMVMWHISGVEVAVRDEDVFIRAFSSADVGAIRRLPVCIDQEAACSSI